MNKPRASLDGVMPIKGAAAPATLSPPAPSPAIPSPPAIERIERPADPAPVVTWQPVPPPLGRIALTWRVDPEMHERIRQFTFLHRTTAQEIITAAMQRFFSDADGQG
jgi:hypothetical protein